MKNSILERLKIEIDEHDKEIFNIGKVLIIGALTISIILILISVSLIEMVMLFEKLVK